MAGPITGLADARFRRHEELNPITAIELNQIWDFRSRSSIRLPRCSASARTRHHRCGGHELFGFKRTLLMTTPPARLGHHRGAHRIEYQASRWCHDKVESNLKDYNVMEAAALYQQEKCDSIISTAVARAMTPPWCPRRHRPRRTQHQRVRGLRQVDQQEPAAHRGIHHGRNVGSRRPGPTSSPTPDMEHPHKGGLRRGHHRHPGAIDDLSWLHTCPHFTAHRIRCAGPTAASRTCPPLISRRCSETPCTGGINRPQSA